MYRRLDFKIVYKIFFNSKFYGYIKLGYGNKW